MSSGSVNPGGPVSAESTTTEIQPSGTSTASLSGVSGSASASSTSSSSAAAMGRDTADGSKVAFVVAMGAGLFGLFAL